MNILFVLLLASLAGASDISPAKRTIINIGSIPFTGGTVSTPIAFSTGGVSQGSISASTNSAAGLQITAVAGGLGAGVVNLFPVGSNIMAVLFSTSPYTDSTSAPAIVHDAGTGEFSIGGNADAGTLSLFPEQATLTVNGGSVSLQVFKSSTQINGPISLPSVSQGFALCMNASGVLKTCTSAVSAGGACTCP
jgi:hypothetical protein